MAQGYRLLYNSLFAYGIFEADSQNTGTWRSASGGQETSRRSYALWLEGDKMPETTAVWKFLQGEAGIARTLQAAVRKENRETEERLRDITM